MKEKNINTTTNKADQKWDGTSALIAKDNGVEFYIRRRWEPGYASWMCGYVRLSDELVNKFNTSSPSYGDLEGLGISYGVKIGERYTGKWLEDKFGMWAETVRYPYLVFSERYNSDMPHTGYWIGFHIGSVDQDLDYKCAAYEDTIAQCERLLEGFIKLVSKDTSDGR